MLTSWQTLLDVVLQGDEVITSPGLYTPNAEAIEVEITLVSGTGGLVSVRALADPALTADAGPFLADSGTQNLGADLASMTDTAAVSFAEIVGAALDTQPRSGHVNFVNRAGDTALQGNCPFQFTYLQITADSAATDAQFRVRARVKFPGLGPIIPNRALLGAAV